MCVHFVTSFRYPLKRELRAGRQGHGFSLIRLSLNLYVYCCFIMSFYLLFSRVIISFLFLSTLLLFLFNCCSYWEKQLPIISSYQGKGLIWRNARFIKPRSRHCFDGMRRGWYSDTSIISMASSVSSSG